MRRTTGWALCGVLAGTVLLGSGGTMATFSDSESITVTIGAAGGTGTVDGEFRLSAHPIDPPSARGAAGQAMRFSVEAAATGAPASLRWTAAGDPGQDVCGPGDRSIVVSLTGSGLADAGPVPLCDLLDPERSVVLTEVAPSTPLSGVVEVRFSAAGGRPLLPLGWRGSFTFVLVQGSAAPAASATVPVQVGAPGQLKAPGGPGRPDR